MTTSTVTIRPEIKARSIECASEGCWSPAAFRFEAYGVASDYCAECADKIAKAYCGGKLDDR